MVSFSWWILFISVTRLSPRFYVRSRFNVDGQFNIFRAEVNFWIQSEPYARRAEVRKKPHSCSNYFRPFSLPLTKSCKRDRVESTVIDSREMIFAWGYCDRARAEAQVPICPLVSSDHQTHCNAAWILPQAVGRIIWVNRCESSLQNWEWLIDDFPN